MALSNDQQQWMKDTGRESFHWGTIPEAYKAIPGIQDWANNPDEDPQTQIQNYYKTQRQNNPFTADQGDAQLSQQVAGGQMKSANQTPAQQWNAQGPSAGTGNAFMQLLMQRAQPGAIDNQSAIVRQQVDPAVAQLERAKRNYLGDVAERQGPRGNIDVESRMANERFGTAASTLEADVLGRLYDQQNSDADQALNLWGNQLNTDAGFGLNRELAYLNNSSQTADRNQAMEQFLRELALREWIAGSELDLRGSGL
jgi:hypothetical protein